MADLPKLDEPERAEDFQACGRGARLGGEAMPRYPAFAPERSFEIEGHGKRRRLDLL
jgi:hypothetical protein